MKSVDPTRCIKCGHSAYVISTPVVNKADLPGKVRRRRCPWCGEEYYTAEILLDDLMPIQKWNET